MDYWKKYYELKRRIEDGKSRDYDRLDKLRVDAMRKECAIRDNWHALGVGN